MYKHPQRTYKNSRGKHLHQNNHQIKRYVDFLRENPLCFFGSIFPTIIATGMVDRICQGQDDAALDRKQQAAEVLGFIGWVCIGDDMDDDEGMYIRGSWRLCIFFWENLDWDCF